MATTKKTTDLVVSATDAGQRIDAFAAHGTGLSRSRAAVLVEDGLVLVNGKSVKPSAKLRPGDAVSITLTEVSPDETLIPEDIPIRVLFRDEHLVVIDKPAGLVVYPAAGHRSGTLMNALRYLLGPLSAPGGPLRPGVVHRLDRDTSGVMVVALDDASYYSLVEQFRARTIQREYRALVFGCPPAKEGEIDAQIGRSTADRKKMSVHSHAGKEARTSWKLLKKLDGAAFVSAKLGTGRTHQIRVHFLSLGHPVLGDRIYGEKTSITQNNKRISFPRQMLHAATLGFTHPVSNEWISFESPLPADMEAALAELGGRD
jgi:23S rRNA pseudouridine1911/1915/1917 synthase